MRIFLGRLLPEMHTSGLLMFIMQQRMAFSSRGDLQQQA
jgi:hypothetical protein